MLYRLAILRLRDAHMVRVWHSVSFREVSRARERFHDLPAEQPGKEQELVLEELLAGDRKLAALLEIGEAPVELIQPDIVLCKAQRFGLSVPEGPGQDPGECALGELRSKGWRGHQEQTDLGRPFGEQRLILHQELARHDAAHAVTDENDTSALEYTIALQTILERCDDVEQVVIGAQYI